MLNQTYFISRFGGSQSQSHKTSKACDRTTGSGTETSDRAPGSDSEEEEEPKDDLDPFSCQGQTETTQSMICNNKAIIILLIIKDCVFQEITSCRSHVAAFTQALAGLQTLGR